MSFGDKMYCIMMYIVSGIKIYIKNDIKFQSYCLDLVGWTLSDITSSLATLLEVHSNVHNDDGPRIWRWSVGVSAEILGRTAEFCLTTQEISQWKLVSAHHWRSNSIIFWHEIVCDSDSGLQGPHKATECPCFASPGFTVTGIYLEHLLETKFFLVSGIICHLIKCTKA